MLKITTKVLFSTVLLCCSAFSLSSAVDTTAAKAAFQFLEESVAPRQIAMGNAGAAMPGAGFCHYNPAQPYLSGEPSLSIGYAPMPGDLKGVFAEGFFNRSDMFFGMHLSNHSISGIVPSTVQGTNENATFTSGFSLVSLAAGLRRERFGLAVNVSGMQDRIGVSTAYGVSISAGAAYIAIPGRLSLGLGLLNEGKTTGYTEDTKEWGQGDRMPRSARIGAAYSDTLKQVPVAVALDVVYRDVGDKLKRAKNAVPRMTVPLGVEVWPTEYVAIRMGKRINFETEIINFGAGFRFRPLSFDMSFVIAKLYEDVEVKPTFGLTYTPARKKKPETIITAPAAEVKPITLPQEEAPKVEVKSVPEPPAPLPATQAQPQSEPQPQEESSPQGEEETQVAPVPAAPAQADTLGNTQEQLPYKMEKAESDTGSTVK